MKIISDVYNFLMIGNIIRKIIHTYQILNGYVLNKKFIVKYKNMII